MTNLLDRVRKWFETSTPKQKWTAALVAVSSVITLVLVAVSGSPESTNDPLGSSSLYFVGAFIKLIGVLLLIVAGAALFRRWLQPGGNGRAGRHLRLLESVRLSPKQAIHLVSIGGQELLIGATDHNVTLLAELQEGAVPEPAGGETASDFGSLLQSLKPGLPSK